MSRWAENFLGAVVGILLVGLVSMLGALCVIVWKAALAL